MREDQPKVVPTRISTIEDVMGSLVANPEEGKFNALGMLIVDSILSEDREALETADHLLQRMIGGARAGHYKLPPEAQGRLLGLNDVVGWGLRRTLPEFPEEVVSLLATMANMVDEGDYILNSKDFGPSLSALANAGLIRALSLATLPSKVSIAITPKGRFLIEKQQLEPQERPAQD